MRKKMFLFLLIFLMLPPKVVNAANNTYIYDFWNNAVPSQDGYMVENIYNGLQLDVGHFGDARDLFVDSRNLIYVLDTGKGNTANKIVVLDESFKVVKVIDAFIRQDGSPDVLKDANGIYVSDEQIIYIADTGNGRILIIDFDGNVLNEIKKPVSHLISDEMPFMPKKVLADKSGVIYVIAERTTQGSLMIDWNNNFLGFYGTNKVTMTGAKMMEYFQRQFMSKERRKLLANFIPIEFTNFDIDSKGFVYTVNAFSEEVNMSEMVRKLNPMGNNILRTNYRLKGDEPDWSDVKITDPGAKATAYKTTYVDISVDKDGFIFALDSYYGRIFQFTQEGNLVFIFGGKARQMGQFTSPVAIDNINGKILVLDNSKNNITVFEPTYFGELVNKAVLLYVEGKYAESRQPWEEVIKMNANYDYAYRGIGKAYFEEGDFEKAKEYFRLGLDQENYSLAKKEIRNNILKENFLLLFIGIILFTAGTLVLSGYLKRRRIQIRKTQGDRSTNRWDFYTNMSKYKYPLHMLRHPADAFNEMRNNNKYSLLVANIILLLWFLLTILNAGYVDMDFNIFVVMEGAVYLPRLFMSTLLLFFIAVISNWSFCTLMDGKGKLINIWITSAYTLIPMVAAGFIGVILTHALVIDEGVFITYITMIGTLWTGALLILSLSVLHEYSFIKTLASIALTIGGVAIIAFLAILMSGVYMQIYSFVMTIISEISIRLK